MFDEDRYAISRIDLPESGTHGWQVRLSRAGRRFSKFFSDTRHEGSRAALEAARAFRDKLVARLPEPERAGATGKMTRRNVSGVVGVSRIVVRTELALYVFWQATWTDPSGTRKRAKFSVRRYGEDGAFERACAARQRADGQRG